MKKEQIKALIKAIVKRNGKPVNVNVVSATIESLGIRDEDVEADYGFHSIPLLAEYIFETLNVPNLKNLKNEAEKNADKKNYKRIHISAYLSGKSKLFIKDYSTGIFHLLPVAIQIITIILFGFSLWTFKDFNKLQSTSVVLGVIIGLISTGGFVQVIGKQVSFYWYNQDYKMAHYAIYQIIKVGLKSIFFIFVGIATINAFIFLYPFLFIFITFLYALLIGLLLLSLAPLYTIKQRYIISLAIGVGTCLALALNFYTSINIYIIHFIGIIVSISISLSYLHFFFKKLISKNIGVSNEKPKVMLAIYRNLNYFFYGSLIYIFIFTDRILAWSTSLNRDLPYIVYYEKDYEIGMDVAILMFFLLAGVLEYSVSSFSRFMEYHQFSEKYNDRKIFNAKMIRSYKNNSLLFLGSAILVAVIMYFVVVSPYGYQAGFEESLSELSVKVCIIGSLSYLFLTFGMLNVLYLYTLNVHKSPVKTLAVACVINIIIGILCSRLISYEFAVLGMLFGSLYFVYFTTRATLNFFKKLDYYYYAAY